MELLKKIQNHGGYLLYEDMKPVEELFGEDFRVGIKYHEHDREVVTIKEYWNLSEELRNNIREVYIVAEDYGLMHDVMKESYIMNDEVAIAKMVKECQNARYGIFKLELDDLWIDKNDYNLFLNSKFKDDYAFVLKDNETLETKTEELFDSIKNGRVSMICTITQDGFVTYKLYNFRNKDNLKFMTFTNLEPFTEEEIEEKGIPCFIQEALESFKVRNLAIFEQIDEHEFKLVV
jgi:hypothetical protein